MVNNCFNCHLSESSGTCHGGVYTFSLSLREEVFMLEVHFLFYFRALDSLE